MSVQPHAAQAAGLRQITGALRARPVSDYAVLLVLVAMFVTLSLTSDTFLSKTNLLNILDQWAPVGIIACAGTLVIIAGGFDLSVGAVFALAGVVAAKVTGFTDPVLGLLAGVAAGAVVGLANGLLATVGRINSFIVTLASSMMVRGIALAITAGMLLTVDDPGFAKLGNNSFLGLTLASWIFIGVACLCGFASSRLPFGRYVFAAGGNPEAARLSGIRINAIRTATFVGSGAAAGIAGIIAASQVSNAQADTGMGLELQAIAAIVIGGTSIIGGEGAVWRTVVGLFILALINNGFNLLGINPNYQQVIQGAIILGAVGIDVWSRRSRG